MEDRLNATEIVKQVLGEIRISEERFYNQANTAIEDAVRKFLTVRAVIKNYRISRTGLTNIPEGAVIHSHFQHELKQSEPIEEFTKHGSKYFKNQTTGFFLCLLLDKADLKYRIWMNEIRIF